MAYEPTNWKAGDIVTSAKLNKMEQGIAGAGPLMVERTSNSLNKTWQEIHDAALAFICSPDGYIEEIIVGTLYEEGVSKPYIVSAKGVGSATELAYSASSADGYPKQADD